MTVLAPSPTPHDQAGELRVLVAQRTLRSGYAARTVRSCRSLAVVSGKGGIGKSVIALNLAMALARRGDSVCLMDASSSVGSLDLMCGLNGYWNLTHVAAGSRNLSDIVLEGPCGIRIVPGASCLLEENSEHAGLLSHLADLEQGFDWLIVDTGSGERSATNPFVLAADRSLIVTTPEPAAIAEAYASLKGLSGISDAVASVIVNRADTESQAGQILDRLRRAAHSFLRTDLDRAGFIPDDRNVSQSVAQRCPLFEIDPGGAAQRALQTIADRLSRTVSRRNEQGYFQRWKRVKTSSPFEKQSAGT